jgi:tRNA dimethylallyltransferase
MNYNLITILGPTAVGKTSLAAKLAKKFNGEIISADSRQVYKGMDIGTGKDLDDYIVENDKVPYHLIDVISPEDEFDLYKFTQHFNTAFEDISNKNKIPFLVGGTGLYLHSILSGYNLAAVDFKSKRAEELSKRNKRELTNILLNTKTDLHNTTDLTDKERIIKAILIAEQSNKKESQKPRINSLTIGVKLEREEIKKRITKRLKERLQNGMIEEAKKLIDDGISHNKLQFFGLEYKYLSLYLQGKLNYNDMYQKLNSAIHNFAKRQMTWFRKMEKEGIVINWVNGNNFAEAEAIIKEKYFGRA